MDELYLEKPDLDECLAHYGVKGMKWGVRKARTYKNSASGRHKQRKAKLKEKYMNDSEKISDRVDKEYDKIMNDKSLSSRQKDRKLEEFYKPFKSELKTVKQQYKEAKRSSSDQMHKERRQNHIEYVKKQSTGKRVVKAAIFGPLGAYSYNHLRSNGVKRGKAAVMSIVAGNGLIAGYQAFKSYESRDR